MNIEKAQASVLGFWEKEHVWYKVAICEEVSALPIGLLVCGVLNMARDLISLP